MLLMEEQKKALIIFVRNPELGKVKTRIAKTAGESVALKIYTQLLEHTLSIAAAVTADKFIFYSDRPDQHHENLEMKGFQKEIQCGQSLGDRMKNAFVLLFNKNYNQVVIIGSDCYELTSEIITTAFQSLNNFDTVIGPALDGGYYLFGMRKYNSCLFDIKAWSTETVAAETIQLIRQQALSLYQLPVLADIDTEEDWNKRMQRDHL
jgi:uncharacterized protein